MWFIANTHQGIGQIMLHSTYVDEFPLFRRYYSGNLVGVYWYLKSDLSVGDVSGLQLEQV